MLTLAYLANEFPSPVEPYVKEEVLELERRGVRVVTGTVRKPRSVGKANNIPQPQIVLQSLPLIVIAQAAWLCACKSMEIAPLIVRILFCGREGPLQRGKALIHTFLGACYAVCLRGRDVEHIHVHHGYFGSWVAMIAARLLGVSFSVTLHGSDLLLHPAYLDVKLAACTFCLTVSEYNRRYILVHYPQISGEKVIVSRIGVDVPSNLIVQPSSASSGLRLKLLAVGRLHPVKDHAFLIRACAELAAQGVDFECSVVGDGPERVSLEDLISQCGLRQQVTLLGHFERAEIGCLYEAADVVVLTSRSEGIPIVLMEAMARAKIVLAPAITGIPELVIAGKTGFLYEPGSMTDFLDQLMFIRSMILAGEPEGRVKTSGARLDWIRHAARVQVLHNFNRAKNLACFADLLLRRIALQRERIPHENFVLQQI
jgi:glycosyltransferase involved in cell wall biosynthesis